MLFDIIGFILFGFFLLLLYMAFRTADFCHVIRVDHAWFDFYFTTKDWLTSFYKKNQTDVKLAIEKLGFSEDDKKKVTIKTVAQTGPLLFKTDSTFPRTRSRSESRRYCPYSMTRSFASLPTTSTGPNPVLEPIACQLSMSPTSAKASSRLKSLKNSRPLAPGLWKNPSSIKTSSTPSRAAAILSSILHPELVLFGKTPFFNHCGSHSTSGTRLSTPMRTPTRITSFAIPTCCSIKLESLRLLLPTNLELTLWTKLGIKVAGSNLLATLGLSMAKGRPMSGLPMTNATSSTTS